MLADRRALILAQHFRKIAMVIERSPMISKKKKKTLTRSKERSEEYAQAGKPMYFRRASNLLYGLNNTRLM